MLVTMNALEQKGHQRWLFSPQMLFGAADKWWDRGGKRTQPHEGLDICFYMDRHRRIRHMGKAAAVPAAADGVVVGIIDDFLGQTVILLHRFKDRPDILSLYGHTQPAAGLRTGEAVKAGEEIAVLTRSKRSNSSVAAHLHLSVARCISGFQMTKLDWNTMANWSALTFVDPLPVIGSRYRLVDAETLPAGQR